MLTEKDYCVYDTCVALNELGYKVPTSAYYMPKNSQLIFVINQFRGGAAMDCFYSNNSLPKECMASDFIDAPTMWEAQKWLREEKGINIFVMQITIEGSSMHRYASYIQLGDKIWLCRYYSLYEEALIDGIKASVKFLKEK